MKNFSFVFFKAMLIARTNLQGSRTGIGSVLFLNLSKNPKSKHRSVYGTIHLLFNEFG